MRILHVIASLVGGAAVQMTLLAQHSARQGDRVAVLAPDDCPSAARRLRELAEVEWIRWQSGRRPEPAVLAAFRQAVRRQRPDVIHLHGQRAALFARLGLFGLKPRPRTVYTLHGFHIPHYPSRTRRTAAVALERTLAPWTDAVICLTEEDRARVEAFLGPRFAAKVSVIPNAVPPPPSPEPDPAELCRRTGVPFSGGRIGTVVRLRRQKAVHVLLEAFARLTQRHKRLTLVVVGDGPLLPALLRQAHQLEVAHRICWLGDRDDAAELVFAFDVFVLPSLWEGMSLALLEAMAAARPIVATDVPGNRHLIAHEATGLLVPPGDATRLAEAIERLLTVPDLARRLGRAAREDCRGRFDLDAMAHATRRVYEDKPTGAHA